jgi:error-prone DNA polymerase
MVKAYREAASMSVFCQNHPLAGLRPHLAAHGVVTAKDLRRIPSNTRVRVTGILVIVHTPPTRSGKRVMFITMEDETGLLDVVAFPKAQTHFARAILTSEVLTVEGTLQRQGEKGLSISIVMEKLILPLTGPLSKFLPHPNTEKATDTTAILPSPPVQEHSPPANYSLFDTRPV